MIRHNRFRHSTPPGWNDMSSAPRDGTIIEIQNNWGVAPWFGLFRWTDEVEFTGPDGALTKWKTEPGWRGIGSRSNSGVSDGEHLSWRPYGGATESYVDPLGGAQNTRAYWIRASGFDPAAYGAIDGETFAEEDERTASGEMRPTPAPDSLAYLPLVAALGAVLVAAVLLIVVASP